VLDPYEMLTDDLAGRLAKVPELRNVQHRIGDPVELLQTFFPKSLLFLDAKGRDRLAEKLRDDAIRQRVSELRRQLATPQGMATKQLARFDPFGLAEVFLGRLEASPARSTWTGRAGIISRATIACSSSWPSR